MREYELLRPYFGSRSLVVAWRWLQRVGGAIGQNPLSIDRVCRRMVEERAGMVHVQARGVVSATVVVGMMDPSCGERDMGGGEAGCEN